MAEPAPCTWNAEIEWNAKMSDLGERCPEAGTFTDV
jgi:hypothetical protein